MSSVLLGFFLLAIIHRSQTGALALVLNLRERRKERGLKRMTAVVSVLIRTSH
jgi:hypothetical protein